MNETSIIAADALLFLDIKETLFLNENNEQIIVRPLVVDKDRWTVATSGELSEKGTLRIITEQERINLSARTEKVFIEQFSSCYTIIFEKKLPEELLNHILTLKNTVEKCSRRKEERYVLGIESFREFGFSKASQAFKTEGRMLQCLVNNVSAHGVMVTAQKTLIRKGDRILLVFDFSSPEEKILQPAVIVNISSVSQKFYQYSMSFTSPISFLWQKRIVEYQEKIK